MVGEEEEGGGRTPCDNNDSRREAHGMLADLALLWQEGSGMEVTINMLLGGGGRLVRYSGWRSTTSNTAKVGNDVPHTSRSAVIARLDVVVWR